jgi:uncharacterized protein
MPKYLFANVRGNGPSGNRVLSPRILQPPARNRVADDPVTYGIKALSAYGVPTRGRVLCTRMSSWSAKLKRLRGSGIAEPSLDDLRTRMAAILEKEPRARARTAAKAESELPFGRDETNLGTLHVRTKRLGPAHRVGRASTSAAADASGAMLALLALDPSLAALDPARALYVDTETTGLSGGAGTVPFLIGVAFFERETGALVVEQTLLRQMGEEAPMLDRLAARIREASMLVSFNGKAFDLPLLHTRFIMNRLTPPLPMPHLDLVHVARRVHRHRMSRFNLTAVESTVLGFERTDDIASSEVCSRYGHFLRTGDDSALMAVIDHNEWDVVAMAALVGIYGEPLSRLTPLDWVGVARTLRRAGSLDLAQSVAERAIERGAGPDAIRARGEIARARGDKAMALLDFASLVDHVDDARLRLDLSKLYEHHAKIPLEALRIARRGTAEAEQAAARRIRRLEAKVQKSTKRPHR